MDDMQAVALLTIRAWCEEGSEDPLRAEIRFTRDVSSGFETALTVAHTERAMNIVHAFLKEVLSSPEE